MRHRIAQLSRWSDDFRRRAADTAYRWYDLAAERLERSDRWSFGALPRAEPKVVDTSPRVSRVPDGLRVYAIGDVHGRADLLERLFDMIEADISSAIDAEEVSIVFMGDYIDRGFQSRDVIDFLLSDRVQRHNCVFLKGNHEEAFLRFLHEPAFGPRWAGYGGGETLMSYGVRPPRTRTQSEEWEEASRALVEALPDEHRSFLMNLQASASIGDYLFVHAGLRPGRPIEKQSEQDFLWIRDEFINSSEPFEQMVVHGHTPVSEPYKDHRRIAVDTGAYMTGHLTAACFVRDEVTFLTT
ncbi:MAG: metallophosphoesterase family protein [Pseudomonadota bacterium]